MAAAEAEEENTILRDWHIVKEIARGTFSTVNKVVSKKFITDHKCLKIISRKESDVTDAELQVLKTSYDILHSISHRHIVRMRQRYESKDEIYMIFDLVRGGTLFARIVDKGPLPEKFAAKVIYQVASALLYLHQNNIMYRDLKAEHVLLTEADDKFDCVLSGSDVVVQSEKPIGAYAGTPGYVAPEVLKRELFHCPIDMWALGCILFIVLGGYPPFDSGSDQLRDIHKKCIQGDYNFNAEVWNGVSDPAQNLIKALLEVNPTKRLTAAQVLKNQWATGLYSPPF